MSASNRCAFHPDRPSVFRCGSCGSGYCDECRAPGPGRTCVRCDMMAGVQEASGDQPQVESARIARMRISPRMVAGILLALNAGVGIWWAVGQPKVPPQVEDAFDAVSVVSQAVERSRDASGRVPSTLEPLLAGLPSAVATQVRDGLVRYRPSADGRTFTVEAAFDRNRPLLPATQDQP